MFIERLSTGLWRPGRPARTRTRCAAAAGADAPAVGGILDGARLAIDAALLGAVAEPPGPQVIQYDAARLKPCEEVRQVVLLSGASEDELGDARRRSLPWPRGTVIYEDGYDGVAVSVEEEAERERVAKEATSSGSLHRPVKCVPAELGTAGASGSGIAAALSMALEEAGLRGERGSVWVCEGWGRLGEAAQEGVLGAFELLAAEGCVLVGILTIKVATVRGYDDADAVHGWRELPRELEARFGAHGLRVQGVPCDELQAAGGDNTSEGAASAVTSELEGSGSYVFTARQMRLSEAQIEVVRNAVGEDGDWVDEDGFEDNLR